MIMIQEIVNECKQIYKWHLAKCEVFEPLVQKIPKDVKSNGHKQVFIKKHNKNNEIIKYKAF